MTRFRKSKAVVLTAALVLPITVALPFLSAFGEGGARRDVVRHAAENNAATMGTLYLVEFEATQAGAPTNREQVSSNSTNSSFQPSRVWEKTSKVRAGGIAAGTLTGAFVIEATVER